MKAAGGDPKQVRLLRYGAHTRVGKVGVASVPAVHSNGLPPAFRVRRRNEDAKQRHDDDQQHRRPQLQPPLPIDQTGWQQWRRDQAGDAQDQGQGGFSS